jgi:hypothetical protein
MGINNPELSFETVYQDEHLIQIEVKASNGRYAGATTFYVGSDGAELSDFAKEILGFPQYIGQDVRHDFGFSQDEHKEKENGSVLKRDMSFVGLNFFCVDKQGHAAVDIILIEDNWREREAAVEKASFELQFDPAALDLFVQELLVLAKTKSGKATLKGNIVIKDVYF